MRRNWPRLEALVGVLRTVSPRDFPFESDKLCLGRIGLVADTEDVSGVGVQVSPPTPSSQSLVQSEALPVLSPVKAERRGGRRGKG